MDCMSGCFLTNVSPWGSLLICPPWMIWKNKTELEECNFKRTCLTFAEEWLEGLKTNSASQYKLLQRGHITEKLLPGLCGTLWRIRNPSRILGCSRLAWKSDNPKVKPLPLFHTYLLNNLGGLQHWPLLVMIMPKLFERLRITALVLNPCPWICHCPHTGGFGPCKVNHSYH